MIWLHHKELEDWQMSKKKPSNCQKDLVHASIMLHVFRQILLTRNFTEMLPDTS